MILMDYSPEQIVGVCHKQGIKMVSHETIYQYIWWDKAHGGELYKHLRHRGRRHKKQGDLRKKRGTIPNRIDISERPKIVDRKNRVGDYEVDTYDCRSCTLPAYPHAERQEDQESMAKEA